MSTRVKGTAYKKKKKGERVGSRRKRLIVLTAQQ